MNGVWSTHVKFGKSYKFFEEKHEWKVPVECPRHGQDGKIKIALKGTGRDGVNWAHVARDGDR